MSPVRRPVREPRKRLPVEAWPEADRAAWEELFRSGDLLDDAGAARHWSAATRVTNQHHYARWLGWLQDADGGLDDPGDAGDPVTGPNVGLGQPWRRADRTRVGAYARTLLAQVAPRTAASHLIGLKCVVQRMAPDEDWGWLRQLTRRLDSWAKPRRRPPVLTLSVREMFDRALGELARLADRPAPTPDEGRAFRDTLIVALLLACPVRLRNLTQMAVGRHLVRLGGEWHLRFEPGETKTGQALHLILPAVLTPHVEVYLARIRPAVPGALAHDGVWAGQKRRPMAHETIYAGVRATTSRLFGTVLNPHAFRSLAATLLAEASAEDALHARALLGHRQPGTTERYYVRACQLDAARRVAAALTAIRDGDGDGEVDESTRRAEG